MPEIPRELSGDSRKSRSDDKGPECWKEDALKCQHMKA